MYIYNNMLQFRKSTLSFLLSAGKKRPARPVWSTLSVHHFVWQKIWKKTVRARAIITLRKTHMWCPDIDIICRSISCMSFKYIILWSTVASDLSRIICSPSFFDLNRSFVVLKQLYYSPLG